uniref:Uncharacterized protein n=1 Tax=Rhizophora mucronata TaxID=61149 RepID=A0A2P2QIA1_RHIMU
MLTKVPNHIVCWIIVGSYQPQ